MKDEFNERLTEGKRVYDYLLHEFRDRFLWLRLCDQDIDPTCEGLSTVFMDRCINEQFIEEFKRKGHPDKAAFYTVFMIFDAYYTMNKPEWIDMDNQEYYLQLFLSFLLFLF